LAERYLKTRGVEWTKAEKFCFDDSNNPEDDELGMQIIRVNSIFHLQMQVIKGCVAWPTGQRHLTGN